MVERLVNNGWGWPAAVAAGLVAGVFVPVAAGSTAILTGICAATITGAGEPNGQWGGFIMGWVLGLFVSHSVYCALTAQLLASHLRVAVIVPWLSMYLPPVVATDLLFVGF
jgi:hypothetical protein